MKTTTHEALLDRWIGLLEAEACDSPGGKPVRDVDPGFWLSSGPATVLREMRVAREASRPISLEAEAFCRLLILSNHYARLLNDYDGGGRMTFESVESWIARLESLRAGEEQS